MRKEELIKQVAESTGIAICEVRTAFKVLQNESCLLQGCTIQQELVTVLKNFKASIDSKVENSRQDNGSRTDNYSQVVNSNLPASFNLIVPIFKGRPAEEIEVEIIADVDGRNIRLSLCSPGAEVIVEEERNKAIDEQLLLIRKLAPDIAIIEQ